MPLVLKKRVQDFILGVWKITEPVNKLEQLFTFSENEITEYTQITNSQRKREWLASRILVTEVMKQKIVVGKTIDGQPFVKDNSAKISISHSRELAVVLISNTEKQPGIDTESLARDIEKVAQRFLSDREWKNCLTGNKQLKFILHWCAKEALFKAMPYNNIDFAKHLHIHLNGEPASSGIINCTYINHSKKRHSIQLFYFIFENQMIAYTFY